ncbi:MAG: hypothetical protein A4E72_01159 [Syntrophus sp. PtaU1.Bin208]|nr:MAG: hypothetical protein A4E72_01159 [Syntrophus sp. PtaU1.Bin208]
MTRWDKILYSCFFFMIAAIGSLLGGSAEFPKWIFFILIVLLILYVLNKDKIDKTFRK